MKGKLLIAGMMGLAGVAVASMAFADPFDTKLQASVFNTKLVQAMDECLVPVTTIGGVDACAPANVTTDNAGPTPGHLFNIGKLLVKSKTGTSQVLGILKSSGAADTIPSVTKKDLAGRSLRVRLTLRVTKRTTTAAPSVPVTWEDQVLNCAAVTVGSNGNFLFKGQLVGLAGCNLDSDLGTEQYQKEIVSAEIVDAGTGKALAVPGVRKKPPGA